MLNSERIQITTELWQVTIQQLALSHNFGPDGKCWKQASSLFILEYTHATAGAKCNYVLGRAEQQSGRGPLYNNLGDYG